MGTVTSAILTIAAIAFTGLVLGSLRIRKIGLGSAGVLFAGILFGHFGATVDSEIAEFAKDFGLILFVFTIGLHLGPGIVQLWRKQGLVLNGMAAAIVVQGVALTLAAHFLLGLPELSAAGLFSGATTNTPSLGAAQQAAMSTSADAVELLTSAYAVAYPGAVLGIIFSMLLLRRMFKVNIDQEITNLRSADDGDREPIVRVSFIVDNPRLGEIPFGQLPGIGESEVRISRIRRQGEDVIHPANEETRLHQGDTVQVVGTRGALDRFIPLLGQPTDQDLMSGIGDAEYRRIFVTESDAINTPLRRLSLDNLFNATVTRIYRAGVELVPRGSTKLHYGDIAHVVGDKKSLDRVSQFLGNSAKSLNETPFSPLFLGIVMGVLVGLAPIHIPGLPFPVKLGLAGGPLVAAIAVSLVGNIGKFVWYAPYPANLALRELGITLFLACAGLGAGQRFFAAAMSTEGIKWMIAGFVITMLPLLSTGIVARKYLRQNFLTICGVIAGSMTDPPALAFANSQADSDASSAAYAAVYPLTMILRIIAAQAIVFALL